MLSPQNRRMQLGFAVLLGSVLLLGNLGAGLAGILQVQRSPVLPTLLPLLISTIITTWVQNDSRNTDAPLGLDQAAYIFFGWPITLPLYAIISRGFRGGTLLSLAVFGIFVVAWLTALVISVVAAVVIAFTSAS